MNISNLEKCQVSKTQAFWISKFHFSSLFKSENIWNFEAIKVECFTNRNLRNWKNVYLNSKSNHSKILSNLQKCFRFSPTFNSLTPLHLKLKIPPKKLILIFSKQNNPFYFRILMICRLSNRVDVKETIKYNKTPYFDVRMRKCALQKSLVSNEWRKGKYYVKQNERMIVLVKEFPLTYSYWHIDALPKR